MGEPSPSACSPGRVHEDARQLRHQHRSCVAWAEAMMAFARPLVVVALVFCAGARIRADEFKPGYLQLTQIDRETYHVLWKIPAIDESTTLKARPIFPDGSEMLVPPRGTYSRG